MEAVLSFHCRRFCATFPPMKRLFIVRHGKAQPQGGGSDFDRPLSAQGEADAHALGQWTAEAREPGAPLCVSPALRTSSTAQCLVDVWEEPSSHIQFEEQAYLASDRAWLGWINAWSDAHDNGWIVGHNPGLSELVERLTDQPIWLPTCGLAEITLHVDAWAEAFAGTGRLRGLFTPKSAMKP